MSRTTQKGSMFYRVNGYNSRADYLASLAEEYEVNINDVFVLADLLGQSEDFDGLVSAVRDLGNY